MAGGASQDADDSITGINVTPLVDVTLVLLIIFMVTAKIIVSQSVPLDLPKAASGAEIQVIFSIVLAANGNTQVDSASVPNDDAIFALAQAAHTKNNELRAVIKADSAVPHGRVIHVLDLLKQAGVAKIAFGITPVGPFVPVPASLASSVEIGITIGGSRRPQNSPDAVRHSLRNSQWARAREARAAPGQACLWRYGQSGARPARRHPRPRSPRIAHRRLRAARSRTPPRYRGRTSRDHPHRAHELEPVHRPRGSLSALRDVRDRSLKPPEAPPPPPEKEPDPVKDPPKDPPPAPVPIKEVTPAAAPAAAKAGAVLTAAPDPDAPANFDGIISGTGETFAGGNTSAAGTSDTAVRGKPAAVGGVPGGTGTAPTGPAAVDHARVAGVSGSKDWNCPFPPEADSEQIDQAFPTIQVAVRADGTPDQVTVISDPGHGFGRAAKRCAMQQHYSTALDHDGNPIPGLTKSISVRFER